MDSTTVIIAMIDSTDAIIIATAINEAASDMGWIFALGATAVCVVMLLTEVILVPR